MHAVICLASILQAASVETVLEEHTKSLARIETIHCRVDVSARDSRMRYEMWSAGDLSRTLQYTTTGASATPAVRQDWSSGAEGRTLFGWDPHAPFEAPLDFALHAATFGRVRGVVGPRRSEGARSHAWFVLGIDVLPGWSLPAIASVSQFGPLEWDGPDPVLRITASKYDYMVGTVVTLSSENGYLLRKRAWPARGAEADVRDFQQFDGVWAPLTVESRHPAGVSTARMDVCEINQPISADLLALEFPEGARVDEPSSGRVHLWGKDGPARTFETLDEFNRYRLSTTKAEQWKPEPKQRRPLSPLFWINLALIPLIGILLILRKRVSRSAIESNVV